MGVTYRFPDGKSIRVIRALGDRVAYLTQRGQVYPGDPVYGRHIDAIERQRDEVGRVRVGKNSERDPHAPR